MRFSDLLAVVSAGSVLMVAAAVLVGIGLFFTYARLGLNNTIPGLVLAHSMHAMPYAFVTMLSALQTYDMNQARVAQSLGASPARAFMTVTLPQLRLSVFAAAFLAFLASFDEVVIALFISGGVIPTLPKMMFQELRMSLANGEQVKLSGFGNFDLRSKNQRPGRNPKTGEEIPISARRVVTFRPGQKLKARVEAYAGTQQ